MSHRPVLSDHSTSLNDSVHTHRSDHINYVGRFAPTPTGPLHFGSLVAALASYLDAKHHYGQWLLRIEDLVPPREDPKAVDIILQQLEAHGLIWDQPVTFQSQNAQRYELALTQLNDLGYLFSCACSRKQLTQNKGLHQGVCVSPLDLKRLTNQAHNVEQPCALRLPVPNNIWSFEDPVYGHVQQNLLEDVGDQVLKRKDNLYAYQLAVVVDDIAAGITHIVRGADLLDNTPRQLFLQQCLRAKSPQYVHLPLVTNAQGQKLSKQNKAAPLNLQQCAKNLFDALTFLNQHPPAHLSTKKVSEILRWATEHWQLKRIIKSSDGLLPP